MSALFLLFNHRLTHPQITAAANQLGITRFIVPPDDLQTLWSQIPPELGSLRKYLKPIERWLHSHAKPSDHVLIQGDFGACYLMVEAAFRKKLIPIYATTRREAAEEHQPDGSVRLTHHFSHVIFRRYGV